MASKFSRKFSIPAEFPDVLRSFAREVLRDQPDNIYEFAAKYFDCLANGLPAGTETNAARPETMEDMEAMPAEEVEATIQDLFQQYDSNANGYLEPREFEALMEDLRQTLGFPPEEVVRFLAEADMNSDGMIEYAEFIPVASQIVKGMNAKVKLREQQREAYAHAEFLVHGMSRDELTESLNLIFEKVDHDGSGILSRQEFMGALQSMELGLTRREVNAILFKVDQDHDGNISYAEFAPLAYDLLVSFTSLHLLELEMESDEVVEYLMDIFKAKDMDMLGVLHVDDIHEMLHQAQLGLTSMQIYVVLSEAEVNNDGMIAYPRFTPSAASLIRSMLSFENSIAQPSAEVTPEEEDMYYSKVEDAFQGQGVLPSEEFFDTLHDANAITEAELKAAQNMLLSYGDEIPVVEAIGQIWMLVKTLRRSKHT